MPKISLFVATTGDDDHPGSETQPFATLQRARQAVRELKAGDRPGHGVTVWIRGGVYECSEPFWLNEIDSGTEQSPVVYSAYPGETPTLSGGKQIPCSAFQSVTDAAVLKRLQPKMRDRVLCADLRALGIFDYGVMAARGFGRDLSPLPLMLYCDGRPMNLARWPADGFARTGPVSEVGSNTGGGNTFVFDHERLSNWAGAKASCLYGYWHWDWADDYLPVHSIDPRTKTVKAAKNHAFGISPGRRFCIINLIEELDQPGEWYLDRDAGILYFYPPCAIDDASIVVSMLPEALVSLDNCSFVSLRGLTLEYGRDNGIIVRGGTDNLIDACTLRNLSGKAIRIGSEWNYQDAAAESNGGHRNGVRSCEICNIGGAGIILSGGDRKSLEPAANYAHNNHIHHFGQICKTYQPAIEISGVGNHVAHNDIHDAPHFALWLSGNDHLIEYNRITDVVQETDDAGAIYCGRNPSECGNVIRHNYFRDIGNQPGYGTAAIFLDDGECGVLIEGNIFHRCGIIGRNGFGAIYIHGGRFNDIRNNIFFECEQAIGVAHWEEPEWSGFLGGEFENGLIPKRIYGGEIDIRDSLYASRYPELAELAKPGGMNRINRNLVIRCGRFLSPHYPSERNNRELLSGDSTVALPLKTVLRAQCDLALEEIEDFEPIPFENIGLLSDWPSRYSVACAARPFENAPSSILKNKGTQALTSK